MYLVPTILLALVAVADAYPSSHGARKCRPRVSPSGVEAVGQDATPTTTSEWTATTTQVAAESSPASESSASASETTTSVDQESPSPSPSPSPQPETPVTPPGGGNVLLQGADNVLGTYYYQHSEVASCNGLPPNMYGGLNSKNQGATCRGSPIAEMNTDSIVAIPYDMLQGHEDEYCGKEIEITVNGQVMKLPGDKPFFVWDGCPECGGGANKIDLSIAGASLLAGGKCDNAPGLSWRILDTQVVEYTK